MPPKARALRAEASGSSVARGLLVVLVALLFVLFLWFYAAVLAPYALGVVDDSSTVPLDAAAAYAASAAVPPVTAAQPVEFPQVEGIDPYTCTAEDIRDQQEFWRSNTASNQQRWSVHCGGHNTSTAIFENSPSRKGKVFVNIGANKGYLTAHFFALYAPEFGIAESSLKDYWTNTVRVDLPCGPCKDCEEPPTGSAEFYKKHSPNGELGSARDIHVYTIEALPSTYTALAAAPAWQPAKDVLSILNLAGDEKPGKIMFSSCNTASEVCAIDPDGKGISVDAISVESFMKDHAIDRIFWLAIDTEGHDPAVLRGAENILAAGRVEVLQFEYNGERGLWKKPEVLLAPIVAHLDEIGYTCFLESSHNLYLLSRCWSGVFEWKAWSNVICVNQKSRAILGGLLRQSMLWDRISASSKSSKR